MFSQKLIGKYISRIVCMVMFVLIQFDIFGYDLIYASVCAEENPTVWIMDDKSSINDSQEQCSEWSDPVYRTSSARIFLNLFYPVFFMLICLIGHIGKYVQPLISNFRFNIPENQSYILFRALLI